MTAWPKTKEISKSSSHSNRSAPTPRLQERYQKEILPQLAEKLGRTNPHALPRAGEDRRQHGRRRRRSRKRSTWKRRVEAHGRDHRPEAAGRRKSREERSPDFKLREKAWPIGCKVTLRGRGCTSSWTGLISLALPRVRDFRGLNPNAFDGHGNYSLGLTEQLVFPELNPDKFTRVAGHEHHDLVTRRDSDDEARELLGGLGHAVPARRSSG